MQKFPKAKLLNKQTQNKCIVCRHDLPISRVIQGKVSCGTIECEHVGDALKIAHLERELSIYKTRYESLNKADLKLQFFRANTYDNPIWKQFDEFKHGNQTNTTTTEET